MVRLLAWCGGAAILADIPVGIHQYRVIAYRLGDRQRHLALLRARTERRDFSGKRALFGKETFDFEGYD